jgi:hypothetical protein
MLKGLYILFAAAVLGFYAYAGFRGLERNKPRRAFAPQAKSMRGTHAGPTMFWYGGYRGGK